MWNREDALFVLGILLFVCVLLLGSVGGVDGIGGASHQPTGADDGAGTRLIRLVNPLYGRPY